MSQTEELTVDESAELIGCSVAELFFMWKEDSLILESSRNRFLLSDVEKLAAIRKREKRGRKPRVLLESDGVELLPSDEDGVRGLAAIPDPRVICRTVNTLSERHVLTARERAFESVGLAF